MSIVLRKTKSITGQMLLYTLIDCVLRSLRRALYGIEIKEKAREADNRTDLSGADPTLREEETNGTSKAHFPVSPGWHPHKVAPHSNRIIKLCAIQLPSRCRSSAL